MNTNFEITKESLQPQNFQKGENFEKADFGPFENFGKYIMENKDLNIQNTGKLFLHDILNLTGAEVSINYAPVGYKVPFKHAHTQNEEIYLVLKGTAVLEVDNCRLEMKEGSAARVAPDGIRTVENAGSTDMIFMVIQVKEHSLTQFTLTDAKMV